MALKTEWLRPEYEKEPLETQAEFAKRTGQTLAVVRSLFSRYFQIIPEPVKVVNGRQKHFLPTELDAFLEDVKTRERNRTSAEVAASEVVRYREAVEKGEERLAKWQEGARKAEASLKGMRMKLRQAEEKAELLRQQPGS